MRNKAKDEAPPQIEEKLAAIVEPKVEETPEEFEKSRAELLSQLRKLDVGVAEEVAEANKGQPHLRFVPPPPPIISADASRFRLAGSTSKKPFTGIRDGKFVLDPRFDPSDMPDADPTLSEAMAIQADPQDTGVPESERKTLTLSQVSILILGNVIC